MLHNKLISIEWPSLTPLLNFLSFFQEEMRCFDMECITMRRKGAHFLALEVPGLAEKRPSLIINDFVFAKLASQSSDGNMPPYQVCSLIFLSHKG